jgi:AraC-like DNA-binding protein
VKLIASRLGISVSLLRKLFSREFGTPPSRILKQLRLNHAKTLLVTEKLTVKEIMARVGFNDLSHFVRDFEAAFGLSPSKHRAYQATSKRAETEIVSKS